MAESESESESEDEVPVEISSRGALGQVRGEGSARVGSAEPAPPAQAAAGVLDRIPEHF